jgi:Ca-activated chloride channel family protein
VGNEAELFALIRERLGSARLFTVGIGSAPNSYFMRRAAHFGRGSFTHIGSQQAVQERMSALFDKLDAPLVTDLELRWPAGARVEQIPAPLPDLYRGDPLLVTAKLSQLQGEVVVSGRSGGQPWQRRIALAAAAPERNGIAARWARGRIEQLLDTRLDGRSEEAIRADVLAVALPHRLLSPYTSFVAVEQSLSRPEAAPLARSHVANARPQGQAPQPYAWPATATDGTESLILGIALLAIVWAMRRACRQESEHELDRRRS